MKHPRVGLEAGPSFAPASRTIVVVLRSLSLSAVVLGSLLGPIWERVEGSWNVLQAALEVTVVVPQLLELFGEALEPLQVPIEAMVEESWSGGWAGTPSSIQARLATAALFLTSIEAPPPSSRLTEMEAPVEGRLLISTLETEVEPLHAVKVVAPDVAPAPEDQVEGQKFVPVHLVAFPVC